MTTNKEIQDNLLQIERIARETRLGMDDDGVPVEPPTRPPVIDPEPPTRPPTRPPGDTGMEGVTVERVDDVGAMLTFDGLTMKAEVYRNGSIATFGTGGWDAAPNPQTATENGRRNAEKYEGAYQAPNDANAPGGAGIYMESEWAVGCRAGLRTCHTIARAWAERMPVARLDWDALVAGQIRPYDWGEQHKGLDRSRNVAPEPFVLKHPTGVRPADHSHMNRAVLPTGYAAKHGNAFCRFMSWCYAQDVRASWDLPNVRDTKRDALMWSAHGIMGNTPRGTGSPILGREIDGAFRALVAAIECGFEEFKADLMLLAKLAVYCFDQDDRALYAINYLNEHGTVSSKWKHKVIDESWNHSIPGRAVYNSSGGFVSWDGARPVVYKTFELARVYLGLTHAQRVLKWGPLDNVLYRLIERLESDNSQLAVIGHPEWSSTEQTPWTDLILGDASNYDLDKLESGQSWFSDNPRNAYTG
tara:strand:- start:30138 stop:31556 length:1419 start_codon:yes stop_codon:yes gene_type:complete